MQTGRCQCGAIRFEVKKPVTNVTMCHCDTCRKISGFAWGATTVPDADFAASGADVLWRETSDWARRGFCGACGSALFYKLKDSDAIQVAAGAFDQPSGLKIARHIYTKDKADFYDILDDAPQIERY